MDTMLRVDSVRKIYGSAPVVHDVSFLCERGSILGLVGPNGAGKSTLLRLLGGMTPIDAGQITLDGVDITQMKAHERCLRGLGFTFQLPAEFPNLSVWENLLVAADDPGQSLWNLLTQPAMCRKAYYDLVERAAEMLNLLQLSSKANVPAGQLSGGQKKLLELGRAMMTNPKLILLDEPAAGVHHRLLGNLIERIQTLNAVHGVTFIVVEHNMEVIDELCSSVICLHQGKLLFEGNFQDLVKDPRVAMAYFGQQIEDHEPSSPMDVLSPLTERAIRVGASPTSPTHTSSAGVS